MEMQMREPLGKRLGRFVALVGTVFALTAGMVITQRLSADALALLVGLVFGVLVMLPVAGLALVLWRREITAREITAREITRHSERQTPAAPPVVVVAPPALPGYGVQRPALGVDGTPVAWDMPAERKFMIVGGEE